MLLHMMVKIELGLVAIPKFSRSLHHKDFLRSKSMQPDYTIGTILIPVILMLAESNQLLSYGCKGCLPGNKVALETFDILACRSDNR